MKALICLILDRSGSMSGKETDVVNGVNAFIEEQKKLPDPASIAFVRFDSEGVERFRPMTPLSEVRPLTQDEYQPRGLTPLLDAVGRTVSQLDEDWKREQPDRAIVVIVTDGQENYSREFSKQKIKEMIEARQGSGKWAFIYLGANVDAFAEAGGMGIFATNTAGYKNTSAGIGSTYSAVGQTVAHMRATGQTMAHNLGGDIEEDGTVTKKVDQTTWQPPTTTTPASTTWTPPK